MNLLSFFVRRRSAPVARERLQILLTHERVGGNDTDLIGVLREEVLAAIAKHVTIDPDKVEVKLERGKSVSILEIEIEVPTPPRRGIVASRRRGRAAGGHAEDLARA